MEERDIFVSCASFTADDNGFPVKENNNNEFVKVDKSEEKEVIIQKEENKEKEKEVIIQKEENKEKEKEVIIQKEENKEEVKEKENLNHNNIKKEKNILQIENNNIEVINNNKQEKGNNNFVIEKIENVNDKNSFSNIDLQIVSNNLEKKEEKKQYEIQNAINEFIGEIKIKKKNDFQIENSSNTFQKKKDFESNDFKIITAKKELEKNTTTKNEFQIDTYSNEFQKKTNFDKSNNESRKIKEEKNEFSPKIIKNNKKSSFSDYENEEEEEDEIDKKFNNEVLSDSAPGSDNENKENQNKNDSIDSDLGNKESNLKNDIDKNKNNSKLKENSINLNKINSETLTYKPDVFMLDSSTYIEIESYNMKNDIIGTYTAFDINIISKDISPPNNKITKCTRRYDNFNTFYFKLIEKYPYKFFPKLSSKKLSLNFIEDKDLLEIRKEELCYLLKFIYSNEEYASLPECINFINNSNFDEVYFKKENDNFSADIQVSKYSVSNVLSFITNYFTEEKEINNEFDINQLYNFYKGIYKNFHIIKKELGHLRKNERKYKVNYKNLSSNANYIKEVEGLDKNSISTFETISQVLSEEKENYYDNVFKEFDHFDLLLCGLIELIERYINFKNLLSNIKEVYKKYINDPTKGKEMKSIKDRAEEKNQMFLKELKLEINNFSKIHGKDYQNLMDKFIDLLKKENLNNDRILKAIKD